VVVSRDVSEGQTVVSSMSAQKLFSIATDLRRVQVQASIPEADIGRVKKGQKVTFTVDAFENTFTGVVTQVRLAAATVQNVVTYPVIVEAENPEELLFPGMTVSIACEVARNDDAVVVPNAALRFTPSNGTAADGAADRRRSMAAGPRVWRQGPDGAPVPVLVKTGLTDGSATQVLNEDELLGTEVIVGVQSAAAKSNSVKNPFAPQMPNRRMMGGGRPPR
jgi:HlyD family secretion protein